MKPQPPCITLLPWLRANLGKRCLAPLTGQDAKALAASVQIAELWTYCEDPPAVARAFGIIVEQMQPGTWHLAFHTVAHVAEWSSRAEMWAQAGLEPVAVGVCAFGPGGDNIDRSKL